jgi:hypothetical protein
MIIKRMVHAAPWNGVAGACCTRHGGCCMVSQLLLHAISSVATVICCAAPAARCIADANVHAVCRMLCAARTALRITVRRDRDKDVPVACHTRLHSCFRACAFMRALMGVWMRSADHLLVLAWALVSALPALWRTARVDGLPTAHEITVPTHERPKQRRQLEKDPCLRVEVFVLGR